MSFKKEVIGLLYTELCIVANEWAPGRQQGVEGHGINMCPSGLSVPSMLDAVCEEIDQTTTEAQLPAGGFKRLKTG